MIGFRMKYICWVLILLCFNILPVFGQADLPLDSLKTPANPSFVLLGISPTNISKPQTPNAFAINVLNSFNSKELVPKNFALESAPYWWVSHKDLDFKHYINPGTWQSMQQNFSFSAATSKITNIPGGTFLAGGIRTIICPGYCDIKKIDDLINQLAHNTFILDFYDQNITFDISKNSFNLKDIIDKEIKSYRDNPGQESHITPTEVKQYLDIIEKKKDQYFVSKMPPKDSTEAAAMVKDLQKLSIDSLKYQKTLTEIRDLNKKKTGFILDFAAAGAGFFQNDSVKNGKFSKWGIWATPTYSTENIDFLCILKIIGEKDLTGWTNSGDTGLRLIYKLGSLGISFETEGKFSQYNSPKFRYVLNFDYDIGKNTYITATFGKDFQGNFLNGNGDLITLLGINFGLGSAPLINSGVQ